jgi:glycosyltransferase involved in cell wall biosynthesis
MKIGIDLRSLDTDTTTGSLLAATLLELLATDRDNTYVLFHTLGNYHLFETAPAQVARYTYSLSRFSEELQGRLEYENDYDILFRVDPGGLPERFPLNRQIVYVSHWPGNEPRKLTDAQRIRRREIHAYQTGGGALAVPDEATRAAVQADDWTTIDDLFVLPPGAAGVAALRAAWERVATRATRPRVRVRTPPVVSIVTPSFNQGPFIRQTIDSVLQQDYPHIDYRVVDGGSTDETLEILRSYGDRLQWISEKDRGQTHAINKGFAQARGEIFAYLNSDDLLRPGAVARVVQHFDERPACDLVYGRDAMIDRDGHFLKMYPTADYSFERLVHECCISQPAAFWRKRLAKMVGPFNESLHLMMDYDYWLRADRAGGVLEHIPEVLAHTRVHREAKSSGAGKIEQYQRDFFRELFAISVEHAGYVSPHYILQWLYATVFYPYPWTRPHADLINYLCQRWYHQRYRSGMSRWQTVWRLTREEWWRVVRRLLRPLRSLDPRHWWRAAPPRGLDLGPDLWLGPESVCACPGGVVRLTGFAACDCVLSIYANRQELAVVPLQAYVPADVKLEVPQPGLVRLHFSQADTLPDGRRVAFKLQGTTLPTTRAVA